MPRLQYRTVWYRAGDYIVRAGEFADKMYFVRSGTCQVMIPDSSNNSSIKDSHGSVSCCVRGFRSNRAIEKVLILRVLAGA